MQCKCNEEAVFRVVKKEGKNQGRHFYGCKNQKCDFFTWTEDKKPKFSKFSKEPEKPVTIQLETQVISTKLLPKNIKDEKIDHWIQIKSKKQNEHFYNQMKPHISNLEYKYDDGTCIFYIPLQQYTKFSSLIKKTKFGFEEIPNFVFDILKDKVTDKETMKWGLIPENISSKLLGFQKEGIEFAIQNGGRVFIGDEMGLGKSLQAIAICKYYFGEWPLLILCPSALRNNWKKELQKWEIEDEDCVINVVSKGTDEIRGLINIVSYSLASREPMLSKLSKKKFKVVLCDESHSLKDDKAKRTSSICPIIKNSKRAILLSGTASPSKPIELFTQIKALKFHKLNKSAFGKRYCEMKKGQYGVDYSGAANLTELNSLLSNSLMIRRLKKDVLSEFPKKSRKIVELNLKKEDLNELQEAKNESSFIQLWQKTGILKLNSLKAFLSSEIKKGTKFLLFAHHIAVMDGLETELKKSKVDYIRIDGNTKSNDRIEKSIHFRGTESCQVALLSITVAGTGLSFTPCATVFFAELHWTPGMLSQAEDRVHRIGQESDVDIRYLIAKKTMDEYIWKSIKNKLDVVGEALDGELNAKWEMTNEKFSNQKSLDLYFKPKTVHKEMEKTNSQKSQTIEKDSQNLDVSIVDLTEEEEIQKEPTKQINDETLESSKSIVKALSNPPEKTKRKLEITTKKSSVTKKKKLDLKPSSKNIKGTLFSYFPKK